MEMISIIICSRKHDVSGELKHNILDTIGTEYELIVVDNSHNNYSIFSAYNEGLRIAKGDILCFMHEDVFFHTANWGEKLEQYFLKYPNAGMVGVAGTHYLPKMPAAWWDTEIRSGHLLQGSIIDGKYVVTEDMWQDCKNNPTQVVSVDGLWMSFQKNVFDFINWDETLFKGFHGYDTDISLQVWKSGYEVHIIWDILIEHKSSGLATIDFYKCLGVLYEKWSNVLPVIHGVAISKGEQCARMRIAELRHELFYSNLKLSEICKSRSYRWGTYIQHPTLILKSILSHILRLFI